MDGAPLAGDRRRATDDGWGVTDDGLGVTDDGLRVNREHSILSV